MKQQGRVFIAVVLGIAVLAAFVLAYAATEAPDKDIVIHSKDVFKEKKKGPVVPFSHKKHEAFQCTDCHHVFKDGKNVWQKGQEVETCDKCHKLEAQDKVLKLEKAFHDKCQNCHKAVKKEGKKTGPTSCTKCHPEAKGDDK